MQRFISNLRVCLALSLGSWVGLPVAAQAAPAAPIAPIAPPAVAGHAADTNAAKAAPSYDARTDRLEGLRADELARLEPQLARGPVALVEFADTDADQLPAIDIALLVHAPAATVDKMIREPGGYPKFMPTINSVDVVSRSGNAIVYDWSFDLSILRLHGRNVMTVYDAPANRPDAASRITIDSQSGDLGQGRFLLRVHPRGPDSSLLVLSMRLDLREANYVARQMAKAARSVNRSANLSLGFAMALHFRREAELRAHVAPLKPVAQAELAKPSVDARTLAPLLERGDLMFFEMAGDRLDQLSIVSFIEQPRDKVRAAMRDARAFGSALVPGSAAKIVSEQDGVTTFDWEIDLPLVGVSGRMRMADSDPVVSIDATEGALNGGRWLFDTRPLGKHVTLVTGWARFDFKNSTWLLEQLLQADPYLGQGLSAASEVMLVRALRTRATER